MMALIKQSVLIISILVSILKFSDERKSNRDINPAGDIVPSMYKSEYCNAIH